MRPLDMRRCNRPARAARWLWADAALCAALLAAVPALAGGNVWTSHGPGGGADALAIDPAAPATVYAGTVFGGAFKSTDGGDTWAPINVGLASTNIFALVIDPTSTATVYAGSVLDGTFKSTDAGATWSRAGAKPIGYALAIDPGAPATLYCGTIDGVFKSTDGGATWEPTGLTDANIVTLAIDPAAPATVYAGSPNGALFKSTDRGATWRATSWSGGSFTLAIAPTTPATLYAGTGNGLFTSTDGGDTWNRTGLGANAVVVALAIDPGTPTTLYAGANYNDGTEGGVFKSPDGGVTWEGLNEGLTNRAVGALAIALTTPETLYAATGGGVFAIQQLGEALRRCPGDCNGDAQVTVDELTTLVGIALGEAPPSACDAGGALSVADIVAAVSAAMHGCGA